MVNANPETRKGAAARPFPIFPGHGHIEPIVAGWVDAHIFGGV